MRTISSLGYKRPQVGRLYLSTDQGRTWSLLAEGPELAFAELQFSPEGDEILYAAASNRAVQESGRRTQFQTDQPGTAAVEFPGIAVDPRQPRTSTPPLASEPTPRAVVPLYVRTTPAPRGRCSRTTSLRLYGVPYPPGDIRPIGWAIAKLRIDPFDSKTLYMSNWFASR